MLCYRCGGTGKYLGNGMMTTKCTICDESGHVKAEAAEEKPPIDRKSQSYQKAIREIMALNPSISRPEAVKMFEEAYNKP